MKTPVGAMAGAVILSTFTLLYGVSSRGEVMDRKLYGEILAQYTHTTSELAGTVVDYHGLTREPKWQTLIDNVGRTEPSRLVGQSEKLAYWLNVYNLFAIDLVVRHYPIASIRDIGTFWNPVWKHEAGRINGKPYTLAQIEDDILRTLGDPRIHAAMVCASRSCPSLSREPWDASRLDAQLDRAVTRWLADPRKGLRFEPENNRLVLSRIFDWFEHDFEAQGGVRSFVQRYAPPAIKPRLENAGKKQKLTYFPYDWRLNDANATSAR